MRPASTSWAISSTRGSATTSCASRSAAAIVAALRGITDAGVPVDVARGNRDFLLGDAFAAATGATLLPEQTSSISPARRRCCMHGDELCTDDVDYQRYRSVDARPAPPAPSARAAVLRAPLDRELAAAQEPRCDGAQAGIDPRRQARRGRRRVSPLGVARMIHGHTHRPARHIEPRRRRRARALRARRLVRSRQLPRIRRTGRAHARNHRMTPDLFTAAWFSALASIVVIDLILAGDNALVIGLAARNVPPRCSGGSSCGEPSARSACARC